MLKSLSLCGPSKASPRTSISIPAPKAAYFSIVIVVPSLIDFFKGLCQLRLPFDLKASNLSPHTQLAYLPSHYLNISTSSDGRPSPINIDVSSSANS
jgi:hypothetical protein